MIGNKNQQLNFTDIENWCSKPIVAPESIYGMLANWGERLIRDEDFDTLYSHTGRPSVSPALLSKVLLLMYHDNVSDREAEDRAQYDLRWKAALGLSLQEAGFDYSALSRFRSRLLVNHKQKLVFERFLRLAAEAGLVKDKGTQIIDSTNILGAGAVKDTYNLIKTAIQKLLKVTKKQGSKAKHAFEGVSLSLTYEKKGKEPIDWDNPKARQELLNLLVQDAETLITAAKSLELTEEEQAAVEILSIVSTQDTEETEDSQVVLKKGVAPNRVISVEDSEMRHGHKTSTGKFNGHKAQIISDEASEIITNISVTHGNSHDSQAVKKLVTESIVKPDTLLGDTAYGTLTAREELKETGVNLVAPLHTGPKKSDRFSKYDFEIDFENQTCRCPVGETTSKTYKSKNRISAYVFPAQKCNRCPLRDQCTKHGKGRIVSINTEEETRRQILKEISTNEFRQLYRRRALVERKIAHLIRYGMRKARYIGLAKTSLQVAFTAAVVNLKRIFTLAKADLSLIGRLQQAM